MIRFFLLQIIAKTLYLLVFWSSTTYRSLQFFSTRCSGLSQKEPCTLRLRSSRTPRGGSCVLWTLQPSLGEMMKKGTAEICWWHWSSLISSWKATKTVIWYDIYMILLYTGTFTFGLLACPPCQSNRNLFIFTAPRSLVKLQLPPLKGMGHIQLPITHVFFFFWGGGCRCAKEFVIIVRAGKEFADLLVRFVGRDRLQSEVTNLATAAASVFKDLHFQKQSRIKRDQMFQACFVSQNVSNESS